MLQVREHESAATMLEKAEFFEMKEVSCGPLESIAQGSTSISSCFHWPYVEEHACLG